MAFERSGSPARFVEALRRLGEETSALVDTTIEQAQQELGELLGAARGMVTAAAEEAAPDVDAARALAAKLGYACIGMAAWLEEEVAQRVSDLPVAEAVRQAHSSRQPRGRGV